MREKTVSDKLRESVRYIRSRTRMRPTIAIILGSGLGMLAESLTRRTRIENSSIPHYPHPSVVGHEGALTFGKLGATQVLAFQGRVHFYESGLLERVLYPIRIAHALGIKKLILTNAAGGVNREYSAGDLMLIADHINLTFEYPVRRRTKSTGAGVVYDERLLNRIRSAAQKRNVALREGIYCGIKGPSYETAAEIEMARRIGADAVGMSTVNEASFAASLGLRVAGISCITNLATGIASEKLSHDEVTKIANLVRLPFTRLLLGVLEVIG